MVKQLKTIGTVCLVVGLIYAIWGMIGMAYAAPYAPPGEAHQYRFDGVYAAEGTVLAVKAGRLMLIGGTGFSVDQPLRRTVDMALGGLCLLMTVASGFIFLYLARRGTVATAVVKGAEQQKCK